MSSPSKISYYAGRGATISVANDPQHPPFFCGEFSGELENLSRELAGTRENSREERKLSRINAEWAKLLNMGNLTAGCEKFLLINGLEVRVLPGSPTLSYLP